MSSLKRSLEKYILAITAKKKLGYIFTKDDGFSDKEYKEYTDAVNNIVSRALWLSAALKVKTAVAADLDTLAEALVIATDEGADKLLLEALAASIAAV